MGGQSVRMLMIDEARMTSSLERQSYRDMGVSIHGVASYKEAVDALSHKTIDVVAINLDNTSLDGIYAIQHLREEYVDLPILALSVENRQSKDALSAGASVFIEQPIPREIIVEKVKGLLTQATRTDARMEIAGRATLQWGGESCEYEIEDLSISGVLLRSNASCLEDGDMQVSIRLDGIRKVFTATGIYVRQVDLEGGGTGFGVKFTEFKGDTEQRLKTQLTKSAMSDVSIQYYL
ncbi:MAG: response regulator [Oligoflexales bacterium]